MMQLVVLSCVLAAASASGLLGVAPLATTGLLGVSPLAPLGVAPIAYGGLWNNNYRGPLSLAPGQPANIIAADGRPLDTLDVNLDRSAHLVAKGWTGAGVHLLKKRSVVPVINPVASRIALAPAPLITPLGLGAGIAPYGLGAGIAPYGLSPYTSIGAISPYGRIASPLITGW